VNGEGNIRERRWENGRAEKTDRRIKQINERARLFYSFVEREKRMTKKEGFKKKEKEKEIITVIII